MPSYLVVGHGEPRVEVVLAPALVMDRAWELRTRMAEGRAG
jgi:hypothetical protein